MKKKIDKKLLGGIKLLTVEELTTDNDVRIYKGDESPSEWKQFLFNYDDNFSGEEIPKNSEMIENYHLPDKWVHL